MSSPSRVAYIPTRTAADIEAYFNIEDIISPGVRTWKRQTGLVRFVDVLASELKARSVARPGGIITVVITYLRL